MAKEILFFKECGCAEKGANGKTKHSPNKEEYRVQSGGITNAACRNHVMNYLENGWKSWRAEGRKRRT
jgi:hypothetical protein